MVAGRVMRSHSSKSFVRALFACYAIAFAQPASAESRGVVSDPVDLRSEQSSDAAVTATVKAGEPFTYECEKEGGWCKITLASGQSGWMERSRIRLYFTEKDLPVREKRSDNLSEIDQFARGRGLDYAAVTRRAARGDAKALKQFLLLAQSADGAAAESIAGVPTIVYHLLGDAKFAAFLNSQPVAFRMMVRNNFLSDGRSAADTLYLRRHFPETTKAVFHQEMVDWFSPDGLYAIRKVFSDEFELRGSKVERAELIERKSGRVLCDLTADDIGTGAGREGAVSWSPDSKRVACLSSDQPDRQGNLFSTPRPAPHRKQTAVYQLAGETFTRVDLPLTEVPGRKDDDELRDAILGHEWTEPVRWLNPNVLLLQRHEYYETLKPLTVGDSKFNTIHPFDRLYEITVTISPEGKANVAWKLRKDHG